jgi:hypothetical protein
MCLVAALTIDDTLISVQQQQQPAQDQKRIKNPATNDRTTDYSLLCSMYVSMYILKDRKAPFADLGRSGEAVSSLASNNLTEQTSTDDLTLTLDPSSKYAADPYLDSISPRCGTPVLTRRQCNPCRLGLSRPLVFQAHASTPTAPTAPCASVSMHGQGNHISHRCWRMNTCTTRYWHPWMLS